MSNQPDSNPILEHVPQTAYVDFIFPTLWQFHISTVHLNVLQLYLSSDTLSMQRQAKKSRHQEVLLVPDRTFLCQWYATCVNPQMRMEMEGLPLPVSKLVNQRVNQCVNQRVHLILVWEKRSAQVPNTQHNRSEILSKIMWFDMRFEQLFRCSTIGSVTTNNGHSSTKSTYKVVYMLTNNICAIWDLSWSP